MLRVRRAPWPLAPGVQVLVDLAGYGGDLGGCDRRALEREPPDTALAVLQDASLLR